MIEEQWKLETRCLSSLSKIFPDVELHDKPIRYGEMLLNETFSFQTAYRSNLRKKRLKVHVVSPLSSCITVRIVGLAPSEMPNYADHDDHIVRAEPGLFPDPLMPYDEREGISVAADQWRSIWIAIEPDDSIRSGIYEISVQFQSEDGRMLATETFGLDVLDARLPEQTLIHTEWFHTDCLATHYDLDVFSEAHWDIIGQYIRTYVKHGMNTILTPLFTPPLDTDIGGERPTVQLVDVEVNGSSYRFQFDKLDRWITLCDQHGIKHFEFSHLFTQWGAKHAPKIMATENGRQRQLFGWETDAADAEYGGFLAALLPQLKSYIKLRQLDKRCFFHVSDEPHLEHLESYRTASKLISEHLAEFPIIDALSSYQFYESGLVKHPIPASNHIQPFLDNEVPDLWTYYCCSQHKDVSNRFFSMPSARNRIIGIQLYKFRIKGFLHWGFNFWYSQYSRKAIHPFQVTDAELAFPSGDAFLVYPGEDGPIESIRMEVFYEALQDLRALQLLESLAGRETVLEFVEEGLSQPITFDHYPRDMEWLLELRRKINAAIKTATS